MPVHTPATFSQATPSPPATPLTLSPFRSPVPLPSPLMPCGRRCSYSFCSSFWQHQHAASTTNERFVSFYRCATRVINARPVVNALLLSLSFSFTLFLLRILLYRDMPISNSPDISEFIGHITRVLVFSLRVHL